MKDKRNCSNNMSYPVYPQPMMPNMGVSQNTFEQQLNNIEQQINLLYKRVTRLENLNNNNLNNKYNDSIYYMV